MELEEFAAGWAFLGTVGYFVCQAAFHQVVKRYSALKNSPVPSATPTGKDDCSKRKDEQKESIYLEREQPDRISPLAVVSSADSTDHFTMKTFQLSDKKSAHSKENSAKKVFKPKERTTEIIADAKTTVDPKGGDSYGGLGGDSAITVKRGIAREAATRNFEDNIPSTAGGTSYSPTNSTRETLNYNKKHKHERLYQASDIDSNLSSSSIPPQKLVFQTKVSSIVESEPRSQRRSASRLSSPLYSDDGVVSDYTYRSGYSRRQGFNQSQEFTERHAGFDPCLPTTRSYHHQEPYTSLSGKGRYSRYSPSASLLSEKEVPYHYTTKQPSSHINRDHLSENFEALDYSPTNYNKHQQKRGARFSFGFESVDRQSTRGSPNLSNKCSKRERSISQTSDSLDCFRNYHLQESRSPSRFERESYTPTKSFTADRTSPLSNYNLSHVNASPREFNRKTTNTVSRNSLTKSPVGFRSMEAEEASLNDTAVEGEDFVPKDGQEVIESTIDQEVDESTNNELCDDEEPAEKAAEDDEIGVTNEEATEEIRESPIPEPEGEEYQEVENENQQDCDIEKESKEICESVQQVSQVDNSEQPEESKEAEEVGDYEEASAKAPGGFAPRFITELTSVEYTAGSALQLVAQVTGEPLPDAVWRKDGSIIDLSGRVTAENEDGALTLSVTLTSPKDAGQYTVEVFNEYGRVKSEAEVILQKPEPGAPVFTVEVKDVIQTPSGSAEFTTQVTGQPKPKVHWQFNDKPIKAGTSYKLERDEDLCKLVIPECSEDLAGRYACVAKNSVGLARSEATLQVVDELPAAPVEESVQETTRVEVQQPIKSSPAPTEERSGRHDKQDPKVTKTVAKEKTIIQTEEIDEDLSPIQRPPRPLKKEVPFFLKTIGDTEVFSGMQARFTACVSGHPLPECEWYRDGIRIYPSDRIAMSMDETGVIRLVMRSVDSTDAGRYRLRAVNELGEAACEADLTFETFDSVAIRPMRDQYKTLEWQLKSGVPMPLVDAPIISRMTDCQLVLSWRPSPPAGQVVPVTYQVEMTEVTANEWEVIRSGVRGCSIEIKGLLPDNDYRFRVKVENKYGVSEPSSHVTTQREKLIAPLQVVDEFLPTGERFRPGLSTKFPENFDMEKWNRRRPQPPICCDNESNGDEELEDWQYNRFYSSANESVRRPTSHLPQPEQLRPLHTPQSRKGMRRPSDPRAPKSARTRALTDDVDGRRSARTGVLQRQRYTDEWETKRGAHIVERLMVRHQVDDAGRNFHRSAGYETRRILSQLPASLTNKQRFRFMQQPAESESSPKEKTNTTEEKEEEHQPWTKILRQPPGSRRAPCIIDWSSPKDDLKRSEHADASANVGSAREWSSPRDWQGEFEQHLEHSEKKPRKRASSGLMSVTDWESRFLREFTPSELY